MTKIEELEQKLDNAVEKFRLEINKFKAELENIKELAKLKESEKDCGGKWKPKSGEYYWFRGDNGNNYVRTYDNKNIYDNWRINNLPIFRTKEEYDRYWRFIDTVKEKSYEFSKEEWKNTKISKYYIYNTNCDERLDIGFNWECRNLGVYYFKTEKDAQYIIDNFKEELLKYWL